MDMKENPLGMALCRLWVGTLYLSGSLSQWLSLDKAAQL